jgi:hypothetical protein
MYNELKILYPKLEDGANCGEPAGKMEPRSPA